MTSKQMNELKYKLRYWETVYADKIVSLSYFGNFESVIIDDSREYPRFSGQIHFISYSGYVPQFVTHLIFNVNEQINSIIPETVTHLTIGTSFNKSIKGCIPSSVTHLTFGYSFNKSIKNRIPSSVTHLSFSCLFNHSIDTLPDSITHLKLGCNFDQIINKLPASLKQLKFDKNDKRDIVNDIVRKSGVEIIIIDH